MTVNLDILEDSIYFAGYLDYGTYTEVLSVIDELRDARITIKHDRDYIKQCEKHLSEMTNDEFWGKD